MKRLIPGLVLVLGGAVGTYYYFSDSSTDTASKPVAPKSSEVNQLPNMLVQLTDGTRFQARSLNGKNILILFQPDCDHCQRETTALVENKDAFQNYTIYFLTTANYPTLSKFGLDYGLTSMENVRLGMVSVEDIIGNFGQIDAPSLYIYHNTQLVKGFNGETEIEKVIEAIE